MTEYRISYFHSRSDQIYLLLLLFMEAFLSSASLASRWTKMSDFMSRKSQFERGVQSRGIKGPE
jgi:hypothetical protein